MLMLPRLWISAGSFGWVSQTEGFVHATIQAVIGEVSSSEARAVILSRARYDPVLGRRDPGPENAGRWTVSLSA